MVVEPGAEVGAGARVADALVLPGARVGAGARLEGSILGPGAELAPGEQLARTLRVVVDGAVVDRAIEELSGAVRSAAERAGVIESPLRAPDRDAIVAAIEENLFALAPLFRHLPGAEAGSGPEGRWSVTDVAFPFFNSILATDVDAGGADAAIDAVLARARRRRVPVLWWTGPRTR